MATYAIGDVQGCFGELLRLLSVIEFDRRGDRLWFVGDLVNRGPQSLEVLRFVRELGERALTVLGNHDLHLVMAAEGFGKRHKEDTLDAILAAPDREDLLAWLRAQPLCHAQGEYAVVHAGLLPHWSIDKALELSREVQATLSGPGYRDFLAHMYGSDPPSWRDDLQGWDRLRVIVNAMTRMRFCTPEGVMDFRSKGPPEPAPPGAMPWFAVPGRASLSRTVVCGHWSAIGLRMEPRLLALDSGCLWGGAMSAVRLEDRRLFQVKCPRSMQPAGWR